MSLSAAATTTTALTVLDLTGAEKTQVLGELLQQKGILKPSSSSSHGCDSNSSSSGGSNDSTTTTSSMVRTLIAPSLGINSLRGLDALSSTLEELVLRNNALVRMSEVGSLSVLSVLDLSNNSITRIEGIRTSPPLHCRTEYICMHRDDEQSMHAIDIKERTTTARDNNTFIVIIVCSSNNFILHNNITVIEGLNKCHQLQYLDLSNNSICVLGTSLVDCVRLETLKLKSNMIGGIVTSTAQQQQQQALPPSLRDIDLSDNNISNISDLVALSSISKWRSVSVNSNPVELNFSSKIESFFILLTAIFYGTNEINGVTVTAEHREQASKLLKDSSSSNSSNTGGGKLNTRLLDKIYNNDQSSLSIKDVVDVLLTTNTNKGEPVTPQYMTPTVVVTTIPSACASGAGGGGRASANGNGEQSSSSSSVVQSSTSSLPLPKPPSPAVSDDEISMDDVEEITIIDKVDSNNDGKVNLDNDKSLKSSTSPSASPSSSSPVSSSPRRQTTPPVINKISIKNNNNSDVGGGPVTVGNENSNSKTSAVVDDDEPPTARKSDDMMNDSSDDHNISNTSKSDDDTFLNDSHQRLMMMHSSDNTNNNKNDTNSQKAAAANGTAAATVVSADNSHDDTYSRAMQEQDKKKKLEEETRLQQQLQVQRENEKRMIEEQQKQIEIERKKLEQERQRLEYEKAKHERDVENDRLKREKEAEELRKQKEADMNLARKKAEDDAIAEAKRREQQERDIEVARRNDEEIRKMKEDAQRREIEEERRKRNEIERLQEEMRSRDHENPSQRTHARTSSVSSTASSPSPVRDPSMTGPGVQSSPSMPTLEGINSASIASTSSIVMVTTPDRTGTPNSGISTISKRSGVSGDAMSASSGMKRNYTRKEVAASITIQAAWRGYHLRNSTVGLKIRMRLLEAQLHASQNILSGEIMRRKALEEAVSILWSDLALLKRCILEKR